jgi:hypothetical protein
MLYFAALPHGELTIAPHVELCMRSGHAELDDLHATIRFRCTVAQPLVIGNLRLNKVSRTTAVIAYVQRVSVRGATPPKNLSGTPVLTSEFAL